MFQTTAGKTCISRYFFSKKPGELLPLNDLPLVLRESLKNIHFVVASISQLLLSLQQFADGLSKWSCEVFGCFMSHPIFFVGK